MSALAKSTGNRPKLVAAALSRGGAQAANVDRLAMPHRLILRALPAVIARRFDPTVAGDLDVTFELQVRDPQGGEPARFQLVVFRGSCEIKPGRATNPGVTAMLGADDMIRLASGSVGWPELLQNGRMKLVGDPFLALRFAMVFGLPATAAL
jgi:hypothetical protein